MLFSFQVGGDDDRIRKRTTQGIYTRVACFGSKTVLAALKYDFRSTPINGHHQTGPAGPVRANSGNEYRYYFCFRGSSSAFR
jgi:hypothetical protein